MQPNLKVLEALDEIRANPNGLSNDLDVMTLSADLARAHARAGVAQSSAARLAQLSREGIIAGARADEARAEDAHSWGHFEAQRVHQGHMA